MTQGRNAGIMIGVIPREDCDQRAGVDQNPVHQRFPKFFMCRG